MTKDGGLQTKGLEVHRRLIAVYGEPPGRIHREPVAQLVSTIISQNTNDQLTARACARLRQRFPAWEAVQEAPVDEIAAAIKVAGLGPQKAKHIKGALLRITEERGELSLDFLATMPVTEAKVWLTSLSGVGPKTAAIVLLFSLEMPAFPVDTHVHRISRRLGLIPEKASREKAHDILERITPEEIYYPFHLNLIVHGRQTCKAQKPRCEDCPLINLCDWFQARGDTDH